MSATTCPDCVADAGDNWFDRSICPEPCGSMHTRCAKCGGAYGACPFEEDSGPGLSEASEAESLPDTQEGRGQGQDAATTPELEGNYEGFYSVVVCQGCEYDNHVEGDVHSGQVIECEGCRKTMTVVGR